MLAPVYFQVPLKDHLLSQPSTKEGKKAHPNTTLQSSNTCVFLAVLIPVKFCSVYGQQALPHHTIFHQRLVCKYYAMWNVSVFLNISSLGMQVMWDHRLYLSICK